MTDDGTTVRQAGPTDVDLLVDLRRRWAADQGRPTEDEAFADRFAAWWEHEAGQRLFWLAERAGEPIGMANLLVFHRMPWPAAEMATPMRWGYLGNIYVRPEDRGAGVGERLVAACTAYADDHDFARVVLSPSPASVPLYERLGFGPATELMVRRG